MLIVSSPRSRTRRQVSRERFSSSWPGKWRMKRHSRWHCRSVCNSLRFRKLAQGSVDLHQKLCVCGPHCQGHVPALARHVIWQQPQVRAAGCSCKYQAAKSASTNAASSAAAAKPLRSSSRDLNLMTEWSFSEIATVPATIPTRLPRKSASDPEARESRGTTRPNWAVA